MINNENRGMNMLIKGFKDICREQIAKGKTYDETYKMFKNDFFKDDKIFDEFFEVCYNIVNCENKIKSE